MTAAATILHADLDAFYASVEQLLDPSLRGKPIAVGGGVVLAASYEAKAFGVRGGMPGRRARELCPHLRFVAGPVRRIPAARRRRHRGSARFHPSGRAPLHRRGLCRREGLTRLFGPPAEIAQAIRRRVRAELGLPISVGVARTKHLAKIASQAAKPDGLVVVDPATELAFLHGLPVELMWGVGPVAGARLAEIGVHTIGQLAETPAHRAGAPAGPCAGGQADGAGLEPRSARDRAQHRARSAGAQSALGRLPADARVLQPTLRDLADRVGGRLRAKSRPGRTVTVRVRFADLRAVTRSRTLQAPIAATSSLAEIAEELVRGALASHPQERTVSLLAISVSGLDERAEMQLELPLGLADEPRRPGTGTGTARLRADGAVDAIRKRFGREAVGYGAHLLGVSRSVPDAFRRLAEKSL